MKYKALMLDIDGTLVRVKEKAMPSKAVVNALKKASNVVSIHLVTARPFNETHNLPDLFKTLPFLSDSIINGGAQIINPNTYRIVKSVPIHRSSLNFIKTFLKLYPDAVAISSRNESFSLQDSLGLKDIIKVVAVGVGKKRISTLTDQLNNLGDVAVYATTSYKRGNDLIITNKKATKESGIAWLKKKYSLRKTEIIGVGDTTHDLQFLLECGIRVAMGNAQQELKKIADFVAPTVDEDGLTAIIERYL